MVRNDLADVVQVCEAKKKQTNYLRSLISDLAKGMCIFVQEAIVSTSNDSKKQGLLSPNNTVGVDYVCKSGYHIAGNIGRELNLAVWRLSLKQLNSAKYFACTIKWPPRFQAIR